MTNKGYVIVARAIRNARTVLIVPADPKELKARDEEIKQVVKELAHEFAADSKKFNPEIFAQACGYKIGEIKFYNK